MTVLGKRSKAVRNAAVLVVAVLLLAGSWKGEDDNFPFGPLRMYSTKQQLNGEVRGLQLWGMGRDRAWSLLAIEDFGLRRADLEGQLGKLAGDPDVLLAKLEETYRRLHDGTFPFAAIQLRHSVHQLRDGRPVSESYRILETRFVPEGS